MCRINVMAGLLASEVLEICSAIPFCALGLIISKLRAAPIEFQRKAVNIAAMTTISKEAAT